MDLRITTLQQKGGQLLEIIYRAIQKSIIRLIMELSYIVETIVSNSEETQLLILLNS